MSTPTQTCQPEQRRVKTQHHTTSLLVSRMFVQMQKQTRMPFSIHGVFTARPGSTYHEEESETPTLIIPLASMKKKYLDFHTLLTASAVYLLDARSYKQRRNFRCGDFDKIFPPCKEMHKPETNSPGFSQALDARRCLGARPIKMILGGY